MKQTVSQKIKNKNNIVKSYMQGKISKIEAIEKIYGGKIFNESRDQKINNDLRKNGYGDLIDMMML